ncbi:MAG: ACP S-malonyltransferase [Spirochaetaceae bacterium]|jgi:[acyl-carrier-protein] S-malonyltransferase|nr:ACP S-malonyltransferase [Spirochaetaceae bacterium]
MTCAFKKPAFLFPGQGSQYVGMALDYYEKSAGVRDLFGLSSEILGRDMKKLLAESGEDVLKQTEVAQGAVTLANLAAAAFLSENGVRAAAAAGHSLGEYAALKEAGVLSVEDCFALVRERGKAMAAGAKSMETEAKHAGDGANMAAVIGLSGAQVEEIIAGLTAEGVCSVYVANFNSSRQTVISGEIDAVCQASERLKAAGARRVLPLKVSGPFHSPLMQNAADAFSVFLKRIDFANPQIPVFSNVTGLQIQTGSEAKTLALRQITSPVRWTTIENEIFKLDIDAALEVGPGKVLCGLWMDAGYPFPCRPMGKLADAQALFARDN